MARILKFAALAVSLAVGCGLLSSQAALADSAADGARLFASQCAVCHAHASGAHAGVGPNLFGVVGRKAGTYPAYSYSPAMKSAGFNWSTAQLDKYLANPQQLVRGNRMPFAGVHDNAQRAAIVSYLATLK